MIYTFPPFVIKEYSDRSSFDPNLEKLIFFFPIFFWLPIPKLTLNKSTAKSEIIDFYDYCFNGGIFTSLSFF